MEFEGWTDRTGLMMISGWIKTDRSDRWDRTFCCSMTETLKTFMAHPVMLQHQCFRCSLIIYLIHCFKHRNHATMIYLLLASQASLCEIFSYSFSFFFQFLIHPLRSISCSGLLSTSNSASTLISVSSSISGSSFSDGNVIPCFTAQRLYCIKS